MQEAFERWHARQEEADLANTERRGSELPAPAPSRVHEYPPERLERMDDDELADVLTDAATAGDVETERAVMDWLATRPEPEPEEWAEPQWDVSSEFAEYETEEPDERMMLKALAAERGLTLDEYAREEFENYQYRAYCEAEEATQGALLTREAREKGIDSFSLFSGPAARAQKYASPELKAYWQAHGRHTLASFRYATLQRPSDRNAWIAADKEMFDAPAL